MSVPDWMRQSFKKDSNKKTEYGVRDMGSLFHGNKPVAKFADGSEGGVDVEAMKQEGLAASAKDEGTGFFQRLREGNIDDAGSEAYWKYGAGRGQMERDAKQTAEYAKIDTSMKQDAAEPVKPAAPKEEAAPVKAAEPVKAAAPKPKKAAAPTPAAEPEKPKPAPAAPAPAAEEKPKRRVDLVKGLTMAIPSDPGEELIYGTSDPSEHIGRGSVDKVRMLGDHKPANNPAPPRPLWNSSTRAEREAWDKKYGAGYHPDGRKK